MEEIDFILDSAKEQMSGSMDHLIVAFSKIRAGKASPQMLDGVNIDYYGAKTPLSQASNINTPDAKTISIQPWDKSLLETMEKAIMDANLGFNPMNNGEMIMINVPPLTEERRIGLAKQSKSEAEHAKVGIRNARKEANNEIKKTTISDDMKKIAEEDIQKLTDKFVKEIDEKFSLKEKEIMKV